MVKIPAKGTTIKIGSTAIAQVKSITPPNVSVETADITELGDGWRKYKAVINDGGEVSIGLFFDTGAATHTSLRDLLNDQLDIAEAVSTTPQEFVITFNLSTPVTCTFSAILTGYTIEPVEIGGVVEATIGLKVTGEPAWA